MIPATSVSPGWESQQDPGRRMGCNPALFLCSLTQHQRPSALNMSDQREKLPWNHSSPTLMDYCLHQEHSSQQIFHPLGSPISGTTALRENGCGVVMSQEEWTRHISESMYLVRATQKGGLDSPFLSLLIASQSFSLLFSGTFLIPWWADIIY